MINSFVKFRKTWLLSILCGLFIVSGSVYAEEAFDKSMSDQETSEQTIYLDKETIAKGYTVSSFNDSLKLSLVPGILTQDTRVDTKIIPEEEMTMPWRMRRVSDIYEFEFFNKDAYEDQKPFYIQVDYSDSDEYKQVFFYDSIHGEWRPLPTTDHPEQEFVRSLIHLPYARIAVFSHPETMTSGKASWYAFRGGNYTASPDFPRGSRLRIFNLENDKFVDVEVNDYGPDRSIHPDRPVDLDKEAFAKIADLSAGIIDVKVEPLYIPDKDKYTVSGILDKSGELEPNLDMQAGVIKNLDGEIIWSHNENEVLPIASLTKLVTVKTFLDKGGSPDDEVIYMKQDAEYNYEYCNPWESAHVNLNEGDVVTAKDLVYSSLVGSANNTMETLIRAGGFDRDDFISSMNEYAKSLGADNTEFVEPSGLSSQNVSTAKEYAIIMKDLLKEPLIKDASRTERYEFTTINTDREFNLRNTNGLLENNTLKKYDFDITASKTGFIRAAGYCLGLEIQNNKGEDFIVLGFDSPNRELSFRQTEDLIKYGLKQNNQ